MDADVEVGVIPDDAGDVQPNLRLTDELRFDIVPISFVAQDLAEPVAQRPSRLRATREPAIEDRLREVFAPLLVEEIGNSHEVEDEVADRNSRLPPPLTDRKDAERKVLDRKIAALRALAPASQRRIVAFIDHGSFAFGNPVQAMS